MSSIWNTAENLLLGPSVEASHKKAVSQVLDSAINSDIPIEVVEQSGSSASWLPDTSQPMPNQCVSQSPTSASETATPPTTATTPQTKKQLTEGGSGSQRSSNDKVVGSGSGPGRPRGGSSLPPVIAERIARHKAEEQLLYKRKLRFLKKVIKDMVYENAALCDQVTEVQQQVVILSEERKFLLKKLCQYQNTADHHSQLSGATNLTGMASVGGSSNKGGAMVLGGGTVENWDTKKTPIKPGSAKQKTGESGSTSNAGGSSEKQTKSRGKSGNGKPKRLCPPITLDSAGRPIFPITLGPLTIHSLGEIVSDRSAYHTELRIYPVGFCSSRIYASLNDPLRSVLYTCKIVDGGSTPSFEVVCEDSEENIIEGQSPAECHNTIMQSVNNILGMELLAIRPESRDSEERGSRFFGLSHPSVQNVLQACPGARKCTNYKWVKFEVCRSEAEVESVFEAEKEASLCHEALLRNIRFSRHHVSP